MADAILIYNARLLDESMDTAGAVLVLDKKIRAVFQGKLPLEAAKAGAEAVLLEDKVNCKLELFDAEGLAVTPAFIDMHVHMRYPGLTAKEDLNTGLHAAAAGGFGTVVAMPNTNPVVSSYELALQIEKEASEIGLSHLFQTVSITKAFEGKDTEHLKEINKTDIPVITEDGHDVLSSSVMLDGMKIAGEKGIIVSCHSEAPTLADRARPYRQAALKIMKENGLSAWGTDDGDVNKVPASAIKEIDDNLTEANSILALAEDSATIRNIMLAQKADCHIHIAHCSTAVSMDAVRFAKANMVCEENGKKFNVTCEVTPHHLGLAGTEEPMIRALVNPPLRSEFDRQALIEALRDGTADVISTDHAPHTAEDKAGGAPGFTGLETAFAVCNTVLVKENNFNPCRLSQLMSGTPARILKLNKGILKPGYDADLTLVDTEKKWIVESKNFQSKGKATPFEGRELTGFVKALFIDGKKVFENN